MDSNKIKKGLGRGLSSLLGDSEKSLVKNKIPIEDLSRNRFQPRKQFSKESIEELSNSNVSPLGLSTDQEPAGLCCIL